MVSALPTEPAMAWGLSPHPAPRKAPRSPLPTRLRRAQRVPQVLVLPPSPRLPPSSCPPGAALNAHHLSQHHHAHHHHQHHPLAPAPSILRRSPPTLTLEGNGAKKVQGALSPMEVEGGWCSTGTDAGVLGSLPALGPWGSSRVSCGCRGKLLQHHGLKQHRRILL